MKSVYNCSKLITIFVTVIVLADTKAFLFFSMVIQSSSPTQAGKAKVKKKLCLYIHRLSCMRITSR